MRCDSRGRAIDEQYAVIVGCDIFIAGLGHSFGYIQIYTGIMVWPLFCHPWASMMKDSKMSSLCTICLDAIAQNICLR